MPTYRNTNELEDDGYYHDRDESERTSDGGRIDYSVWRNEDGDEVRFQTGGESRNDMLGFEDDDHFEDNMM